jgi:hypothetical protein
MAKKPDYIQHSGSALFFDEFQLRRVTSFSADTSFNSENLLELSNAGVAETIDDLETVSTSVDCHEFGSTDNLAKATNQFSTSDNNNHILTDSIIENAQVDQIVQLTSGTNTNGLLASIWYGSQWLTGISLNYSVDGTATENYSFEGEYKRAFLNSYRDMRVATAAYSSSTVALITGLNLETGYVPRVLTVNGLVKADVSASGTITFTDSSSDTQVSATSDGSTAVTFASGDRIRVIYAKTAADAFSSYATSPAGLGALRRGMLTIYLYNPTSGNKEEVLRLQSVGVDISFDREATSELGNKKSYTRSVKRPITVEVSAEALLSDFELFAKLANKETEFDNGSLNEINWDSFSNATKLVIAAYNSDVTKNASTLLKEITISNLSISNDSHGVTAGDKNTVSITMTADNFLISGSSVSPFLS